MRARKKLTEGVKPWYQTQLMSIDLPNSNVGHDAMQSGIEYNRTGISAQTTVSQVSGRDQVPESKSDSSKKPPKRRRQATVYDPTVPFRLSKDASKIFMAANPGLVQKFVNYPQTTSTDTAMPRIGMGPAPYFSSTANDNVNFVFPSRSQAQVSFNSPIVSTHKEHDEMMKNASVYDNVTYQNFYSANFS